MNLGQIASDKPVVTILTLVAATVAIVVGGIVTITNPQSLSFHQYVQDIAFMAGALGLGSGIGRGIDSYGGRVTATQRTMMDQQIAAMQGTQQPPPPPGPPPAADLASGPPGMPPPPPEPPPARHA
jgi:hypothetical protein